jgi:hypothetical protein
MEHHAGCDVSSELSSVCVVDAQGKIVRETSTPRRLTPRATLPPLLTSGFAGLSKPSPIRWR